MFRQPQDVKGTDWLAFRLGGVFSEVARVEDVSHGGGKWRGSEKNSSADLSSTLRNVADCLGRPPLILETLLPFASHRRPARERSAFRVRNSNSDPEAVIIATQVVDYVEFHSPSGTQSGRITV